MARKRAPRSAEPAAPKRTADKSGERAFIAFVMLVHAAVTLYVAMHHEPWRDEADVWLLMRDGGVRTMLARLGYIGMPPVWYLLVAPLAKLGLPYFSMTLLNLVIAWSAVFVFLAFAPLPKIVRLLFVFSYFMSYEYAVVARPYAPAVLFFFAALACWKKRDERPIPLAIFVALMALTTTHTLFFGAVFGAAYLWETIRDKRFGDRQRWIAIAITAIGGLLSAYLLRPPKEMGESHVLRGFSPSNLIWTFGNAVFPDIPLYVAFALAIAVIVIVTLSIGRRLVPQFFLWSSLVFLALLYTFVWAAGLRHAGLITMAIIGALWLADSYPAPPSTERWRTAVTVTLSIAFVYSAIVAFGYWHREVIAPFSSAKEMADYITANHLQRYPIAAHPPPNCESLLPYIGGRFYYPALFDYGSYMFWDRAYNTAIFTPYGTAVAQAQQEFQGEPWLLLVNEPMKRAEEAGFRLLYATRETPFEHRDERYWLYAPGDWSGLPLPETR